MTISDGDVAALAGQAVDLLDPATEIRIDPDASDDPYRFGAHAWLVWPLFDGERAFGIRLTASSTPAQALAHLLDQLSENVSETEQFWGVGFPHCPGHAHPARVEAVAAEVVLRCPDTDEVVARIRPDVP